MVDHLSISDISSALPDGPDWLGESLTRLVLALMICPGQAVSYPYPHKRGRVPFANYYQAYVGNGGWTGRELIELVNAIFSPEQWRIPDGTMYDCVLVRLGERKLLSVSTRRPEGRGHRAKIAHVIGYYSTERRPESIHPGLVEELITALRLRLGARSKRKSGGEHA